MSTDSRESVPIFWTHTGANYIIRVDCVSSVHTESSGDDHRLSFRMSDGQNISGTYETAEARDTAFLLFRDRFCPLHGGRA